ncbi:hypothetical protein M8C21_006923 [Ambrosia artemisiifolia]|uniref:TF-B3 domain-containing protein n=1 Tax=Ambrosia artemisiifolia TaxID=4212 RepID=A0AAD5BP88_AMBAR|nr:hypothetical protein M8C21_006923 [Ambrosia artemisiifolia]
MLPHPVVIHFGDVYPWTVLIQWYIFGYYFTDGWSAVFKDLKLRIGDFLMFEKVAEFEFKLDLFREDGMRVDPDEIGNENDEVIEVSSDVSENSDSQNEYAVPDHEVITKVTNHFRFPIPFGKDCQFENVKSLRIQVENGNSIIKKLRVEGSGSKRRYAIRE